MCAIIKKLLDAAHHFTAMDFAALKLYLLCFGILLGSYFNAFFLRFDTIIWIVFIITLIILIVRTICLYKK